MTTRSRRLRAATVLSLALVLQWRAARAESDPSPGLHAGQLTATDLEAWRVRGADAIGGLDDWALSNGTVCAVISDPSHEAVLAGSGGVLIDLGLCGRADDQYEVLHPMMNLSQDGTAPVERITAGRDGETAWIETGGATEGVRLTTRYELDRRRPRALRIVSRLHREGPGAALAFFGDVSLHSNAQMRAFAASTSYPERSPGFEHPAVDIDDYLAMVSAMRPTDLHVFVADDLAEPGIAYGLHLVSALLEEADGRKLELPYMGINGEHFTLLAAFARPFWVGGNGRLRLLELAQTLFMDLSAGQTLVFERKLWVGERSDVAAITDLLWADAGQVRGHVNDANARIHVTSEDGIPVTEVRPHADGRFAFRLRPGSYRLAVRTGDGRELTRGFRMGTATLNLSELAVTAPARVELPRDLGPARLVFVPAVPVDGPLLGDDGLGFRIGDERPPAAAAGNFVSLAGVEGDPREIALPPGRYTVYATRGPEYDAPSTSLDVKAGQLARLAIERPRRAVSTPGWIAADLHVHAAPSADSAFPLTARIREFAASGTEVVVATEHDNLVDYAPVIRKLGLEGLLASVVGSELTSTVHSEAAPHTLGHVNAFPLVPDPTAYRRGTPSHENRRLRTLVSELRARPEQPVIQLNHPRRAGGAGDGHFYSHLSIGKSFDPTLPLDAPRNRSIIDSDPATGLRDLDYDVIELMNGPKIASYRLTRADWFSQILQGEYRPGTANSDTHRAGEIAGLPRSYVRAQDDLVTAFDEEAFIAAIRKGRLFGTTGPFVFVELVGDDTRAGIGELFSGARGTLRLRIEAAPWVPLRRARVFLNSALLEARPVERGDVLEVPLEFASDAFVFVEVEGPAEAPYADIAPGMKPFAFTNPIFVDADGDGKWQAPGLPRNPPATIRNPNSGG